MFNLVPERREIEDLFFNPFESMFADNFAAKTIGGIKTDIRENDSEYVIESELPGFSKDDVKINVDKNILTITAKREEKKEEKDKRGNYIHSERSYGSFSRSFNIVNVEAEKIEAGFENGVLEIKLPKKEKKIPEVKEILIK